MKTYELKAYGKTFEVVPFRTHYMSNNTLAVALETMDEGMFADMTVNIAESDTMASKDTAFVDTNNCAWAEEFIKENNLGEPTGYIGRSGFCSYPLYRFNLDKMESYEMD